MEEFLSTHIGTIICVLMAITMLLISLPFFIGREKAAGLVAGFNTLSEEEQKQYDKKKISKGHAIIFVVSSIIFVVGTGLSLLNQWLALISFLVWLLYFLHNVSAIRPCRSLTATP